jgi:hypothetical protein
LEKIVGHNYFLTSVLLYLSARKDKKYHCILSTSLTLRIYYPSITSDVCHVSNALLERRVEGAAMMIRSDLEASPMLPNSAFAAAARSPKRI